MFFARKRNANAAAATWFRLCESVASATWFCLRESEATAADVLCAKAQCQRSVSNRVSSVRKRSANVAAATWFRLCESAVST